MPQTEDVCVCVCVCVLKMQEQNEIRDPHRNRSTAASNYMSV